MEIKKAVIPVAGKGTRFLPATKEIPKEMIPINGIPMIHYVVQEAIDSGIEEIVFVSSKGKEALERYFSRNYELEKFLEGNNKIKELELIQSIGTMAEISTVNQEEQLGLGHAVNCAKEVIGKENFAVLLGDDLIRSEVPVTKQLLDKYYSLDCSSIIGVMEVPLNDVTKYGIIDGSPMDNDSKTVKMKVMVEKPTVENTPSRLATPGRYILTNDIFKCLDNIDRGAGGEYQLTDAINMLASQQDVYAHIFSGDRFDTGNLPAYLEAMVEFALRDLKTKEIMEDVIKKVSSKYNL
ncbi:MAG: UTP--glucose-1-phosphate uridylyltransferase [Bdellovibrionales bacterium]|nr:UTP--glucose-1-phosphate uridylyltransferase [Bdellovibrionales bacterium]